MLSTTLVNNRKYIGKFVALISFNNRRIVASGKDLIKVCEKAEQRGFADPLIICVIPASLQNLKKVCGGVFLGGAAGLTAQPISGV